MPEAQYLNAVRNITTTVLFYDIKLVDGVYSAIVAGSYNYKVKYDTFSDEFSCNCPYDDFCKHQVALGLALLDLEEQIPEASEQLEKLLNKLTKEQITDFLKQNLSKYITIADDLKDFVDNLNSYKSSIEQNLSIEDISAEITDNFIISEPDYPFGYDYHDYEDSYEAAYEEAKKYVKKQSKKLQKIIDNGNLDSAVKFFIGSIIGFEQAIKSIDEWIADDVENAVYDFTYYSVPALIEKFNKTELLDSLAFYISKYPDIHFYYVRDLLEKLLSEETVQKIISIVKPLKSNYGADKLLLSAYQIINDTEKIKKLAKKYPSDSFFLSPAAKIFADEQNYSQLGETLFNLAANQELCELKSLITDKLPSKIYKELLKRLVIVCGDYNAYSKLKDLFSNDEKEDFFNNILPQAFYYPKNIAIKILIEEQKYDIILKFAEEQIHLDSPFKVNIITLLNDLERILPNKVWKLYKAQAMLYYNLKSRSGYKEAIIYFTRMKKIDPKETKTLLKELYDAKPIRPAFREEVKKSRLLN